MQHCWSTYVRARLSFCGKKMNREKENQRDDMRKQFLRMFCDKMADSDVLTACTSGIFRIEQENLRHPLVKNLSTQVKSFGEMRYMFVRSLK